ncbi:MAG: hypothetical protein H6R12_2032 [Proteobacteria bacterium]|nr:hypothetical protein [Pseudomonadota bacterium]
MRELGPMERGQHQSGRREGDECPQHPDNEGMGEARLDEMARHQARLSSTLSTVRTDKPSQHSVSRASVAVEVLGAVAMDQAKT